MRENGDIWEEKEFGIFVTRNGGATIAGLKYLYFDIKLLGSSESSAHINQNNYKSYVQTFRKNSENFKLTVEEFDPTIFVISKN